MAPVAAAPYYRYNHAAAPLRDGRLLAYHDWSRELAALTDPGFRDHCAQVGIRLVSFRALAAE